MTQIVVQNDIRKQFYAAIEQRQLAASTTKQYRRAIDNALDAGVELRDAESVAAYAVGLKASSRAFLRSAVVAWAEHQARRAKAQATPENVANVQAVVFRLDALKDAIAPVDGRKRGQKAHIWLSRPQVRRLFDSVDRDTVSGRRDRVLFMLLVGAGLRCEEASTLRFENVVRQGSRWVLDVEGKGAKARVVPITDLMVKVIEQWRKETDSEVSDLILRSVNRGGNVGKRLACRSIQDIVPVYGESIGLSGLAPHDLRRTYAQIGLDNGIPIQQISKLLGHASIQTTERYLNVTLNLDETIADFVPM